MKTNVQGGAVTIRRFKSSAMPTSLKVARWNTRRWVERFEGFIHHAALVGRASSVYCGNIF